MDKYLLLSLTLMCGLPLTAQSEIKDNVVACGEKTHSFDALQTLRTDAVERLEGLTAEERSYMEFLYDYMPLADLTDYTADFFLSNVRMSIESRRDMPWGRNVPELLFKHFVLPVRVNNENLDISRIVFFEELKDRVKGLSMKDAILEVNHWCHEKVTYRPSDGRTSAPLATVRSAYGRCGEQSTFAVAALRSVGIPARQVYTPRWAHTDDNHAWVEAWADGKWYFLGACEPEPVLNIGWFNAPASRAMLMHTKAFGNYQGPEEVFLCTSNYTEINLIGNYADTARVDFIVVDENGLAVKGAKVDFRIYNYAEFCPVVTKYTAEDGKTFLTAGKGDMMVWASLNGRYGFKKVSFGKDKNITITLDRMTEPVGTGVVFADSFDIQPPQESPNIPFVSKEQRVENDRRFAYEDSVRHAYLATFYDKETAMKVLRDNKLVDGDKTYAEKKADFLVKAQGNHEVILCFLLRHKDKQERAVALLSTLSDKDLRDMPMEILEDNFMAWSDELCPRVENEMIIHPFKKFFEDAFSKKDIRNFQKDPSQLVAWVKQNIHLNPDEKALKIAQTPVGVWNSRYTDRRSRKIFFVDVARSLGVEARVDAVTQKVQYRQRGEWIDVDFDGTVQKTAEKGTLRMGYHTNGIIDDPKYYSHFSLTRINNDGSTTLLEYPEDGITWSNTFKNGVELDVGQYVLVSGTRLANGGVMSAMQIFNIEKGKTTDVDLRLRTSPTAITVIGSFDSESKFRKLDGTEVSLLSQTGRGYFVTGLIGVGQEPTNHALKDITKVAAAFDKWNRPFVLLFEDEAAAKKFNASEFTGLPKNVIFGIDKDGVIRKQVAENMKLSHPELSPIFIISDTFNRVVYKSQGYTIGLGEQMDMVVNKL